ncbi:MAG: NAD(P)-dependent oxidoreductase [Anaerolineae bacterium]|jgi:predicted homoserine dehydrogenase-like protein|nr:NAD(P)-dependent oxidoreductase [Anaerolineae bacterium]MBT7192219.1 NAD(P)-dependent oxidoreductase [Anaerolineae bacterium]MBT7989634.1 NAD(P)-dependent oxidoreductase [Anaerolineae bacterium]
MIIVDKLLKELDMQDKPIKVAMVGAGFMAKGIARQITMYTLGMELVAVSNRHIEGAEDLYREVGRKDFSKVADVPELEEKIHQGIPAVTDDPLILCQAGGIDAIVEVTGSIEFAAKVTLEALKNGKHFVSMNAELDATLGPLFKRYADEVGVIYTFSDGDQPGVTMNLFRFVQGLGIRPVLCGNIKGLQDPYRNPTTQEGFAKKWGQKAHMVTSFADGTKISFEQAVVANATGMRVAKRGMYGPTVPSGTPLEDVISLYPLDDLLDGPGIVDYVVGVSPGPGVFVLGTIDDPIQRHYLNLYKLGEGPLYSFYTPYHLCHFEVPSSIARAVLLNDATIASLGPPLVEVVATAKIDIRAGQELDGIGYYTLYGQCENADITRALNLLPMGVAEGCKTKRDIAKDEVLTYDDVELPERRLVDYLRSEQRSVLSL